MRRPSNPTAIKFQELLNQMGLKGEVAEFEEATSTASAAAAAIGCDLGQIVKSLIFRAEPSGSAVLVLTSGLNRVDEKLLQATVGEKLGKADAAFVRSATGYSIGGVPPFGYKHPQHTYIDEDLLQYKEVWAAAGTPNAVFPLMPEELQRHAGAKVIRVH